MLAEIAARTLMVYINAQAAQTDIEAALQAVSPQRREQALRHRHEQGQRLSLAAYLLLWQGLQAEYGLTEHPVLGLSEHGKPYIVGHPDIHFNLSHSRHVAACVIDSQPVGIDVEVVRPWRDSLARYVLSDAEYAMAAGSDRPEWVFTRLWTQKEALQKLRGTGITNHMRHVLEDLPPTIVFDTREGPDYVCTIARQALPKTT